MIGQAITSGEVAAEWVAHVLIVDEMDARERGERRP